MLLHLILVLLAQLCDLCFIVAVYLLLPRFHLWRSVSVILVSQTLTRLLVLNCVSLVANTVDVVLGTPEHWDEVPPIILLLLQSMHFSSACLNTSPFLCQVFLLLIQPGCSSQWIGGRWEVSSLLALFFKFDKSVSVSILTLNLVFEMSTLWLKGLDLPLVVDLFLCPYLGDLADFVLALGGN